MKINIELKAGFFFHKLNKRLAKCFKESAMMWGHKTDVLSYVCVLLGNGAYDSCYLLKKSKDGKVVVKFMCSHA